MACNDLKVRKMASKSPKTLIENIIFAWVELLCVQRIEFRICEEVSRMAVVIAQRRKDRRVGKRKVQLASHLSKQREKVMSHII